MKIITIITLIITILSTNLQCSIVNKSKANELPVTLYAYSWSVAEVNGEKISPGNNSYTITFDKAENKFFGMGDCNRFFGTYSTTNEANDNSIKLENIGSTRMMCPDQATEDKFFIVLNEIDSYQIEKNILQLKGKTEAKITFKPIPKIQIEK